MLDIETLATTPDAVVLSFAAVKFNEYNSQETFIDELNLALDVDEQLNLGRSVNQETLNWWATQPKEIQEAAFGEQRVSLREFTKLLNKFLVGSDRIWAQGPVFDIAIMENLYRQLALPIPWQYYNIRDSRTIIKALGSDIRHSRTNAHDALADCKFQAGYIKKIVAKYKLQTL
jgi:hypothetical protein